MTGVLDQLASASGESKQDLNIELARKIAADKNKKAVEELIGGLKHKQKAIRHDCIKTLYEIAAIEPILIALHADTFIALLKDKDNRMQWGAMTALSEITGVAPGPVYNALPDIIATADAGSVITKDHCVRILALLSTHAAYADTTLPLLLEQLLKAPANQAPSYAEQTLPVVTPKYHESFKKILLTRISDTEQDSKRKRLEKVLKKLK